MHGRNEAQDWANKRKVNVCNVLNFNHPVLQTNCPPHEQAAVERAALMREQRKNGGNDEEQPPFAPQINKRPSYLKQDSLDKLTVNYTPDPSDIFEQPLPGARGAHSTSAAYAVPKLPSPGSDALGKEMKRYPSNGNPEPLPQPASGQYKSKFLQQYGSEQNSETDGGSYGKQYQQQQHQQHQGNPPVTQVQSHRTPVKAQEEADEAFMSTLRGGSANSGSGRKAAVSSNGPGWNDDVTTGGFGAPPKLKAAAASKTTRPRQQSGADQAPRDEDGYGARHSRRTTQAPQSTAARQPAQRDWNDDIEVTHTAAARTVPARPQATQQREWNMDTEVSHNAAARALPPTSPRVSPRVPAQRPKADSAGAAVAAQPNLSLLKSKIRRSGSGQNMSSLQTSSTSSFGNESDSAGGYAAEQVASINRNGRRSAPNPSFPSQEEAPIRGGRASRSSAQDQYDQQADSYYEEPPQRQAQPRVRPQEPQGKQAPRQPASRPGPAESRWDDAPQEPPRQSAPRRAPADSRWDDTPAQEAPQRQAQAQAAQPRRAAPPQPQPRFDEAPISKAADPFGPDAYPPGGIPEQAQYEGPQQQCPHCERFFNPTPFAKHVKICVKVFVQKRKEFNSAQKRLDTDDPEMQKLAKAAAKEAAKKAAQEKRQAEIAARNPAAAQQQQQQQQPARTAPSAPVAKAGAKAGKFPGGGDNSNEPVGDGGAAAKWKAESNAFREAMKAARMYNKAKAEGKPLPPPMASAPDPSLVPCPNCGRSFNQKAADRHIPQCSNIKAKPTALKRGAGGGGGLNGTLSAQQGATTKGKRGFMG
jgi:rubrerythrin